MSRCDVISAMRTTFAYSEIELILSWLAFQEDFLHLLQYSQDLLRLLLRVMNFLIDLVDRVYFSQDYNKSHSVTAMKANPLGGSSMAKGIVLEKM